MEKQPREPTLVFNPDISSILKNDHFLKNSLRITKVTSVSDGVAHYVFRLNSQDKKIFLKIRGNHFSRLPEIAINPEDIKNEHKALKIFRKLLPDNFPQILSFNSQQHYLITSDAAADGELFQEMLLRKSTTQDMVSKLGRTLRKIHSSTAQYTEDIREEGDGAHYDIKLLHRFGFAKNNGLEKMIEKLKNERKQLILGDPAPKNIGVNNNGSQFIFFDLEDAHQGNPVFDYGYLLGHILIHNLQNPQRALELTEAYIDGYGKGLYDEDIIKKIALGIMRYRLAGKVPYPTPNIPSGQKVSILNRIEDTLETNLESRKWDTILQYITA